MIVQQQGFENSIIYLNTSLLYEKFEYKHLDDTTLAFIITTPSSSIIELFKFQS